MQNKGNNFNMAFHDFLMHETDAFLNYEVHIL